MHRFNLIKLYSGIDMRTKKIIWISAALLIFGSISIVGLSAKQNTPGQSAQVDAQVSQKFVKHAKSL